MMLGIIGRGALLGTDLGEAVLIHRHGDRLKFALGQLAIGANTSVQHGHQPIIGRGQHRAPVPRLQPVGGPERQANVDGCITKRRMNPAPPENVAAAIDMLERGHGR